MSRVGPPSNDLRGLCEYSPELGDPICGAIAVRHIAVMHGADPVGLAACADHAAAARSAGPRLGEHEYGWTCDMPGSLWLEDLSGCVLATGAQALAEVFGLELPAPASAGGS